jgi:hypothetical protein
LTAFGVTVVNRPKNRGSGIDAAAAAADFERVLQTLRPAARCFANL